MKAMTLILSSIAAISAFTVAFSPAAGRATALLGSDFSEITKWRHFAIDPVDCRSQSCVAT
jgi:hypothetical protein